MEQQRFDDLSRRFASGLSRRRALGLILGVVGGLGAIGASADVCRPGGAGCSRDGQCCTKRCFKRIGRCSCDSTPEGSCKPPATNPCKRAVCNAKRRCVDGPQGYECADGKGCNAAGQCVDHCQDGAKNYNEEGVDCGGSCGACPANDGETCNDPSGGDCESGICQAQVCRPKTCGNGAVDAGETDLDCGGPCFPCGEGKSCETHADCETGICCKGECLKCDPGEVCIVDAESNPACCKPNSFCVTCKDNVGPVMDNCGRSVDCGSAGTEACAPPNTFAIPGTPSCCSDGDCACDGGCCADGPAGDACFIDLDGNEFCCRAQGENYHVCGNVCCSGPCDENGDCPQQAGRLGSYRRGPVG